MCGSYKHEFICLICIVSWPGRVRFCLFDCFCFFNISKPLVQCCAQLVHRSGYEILMELLHKHRGSRDNGTQLRLCPRPWSHGQNHVLDSSSVSVDMAMPVPIAYKQWFNQQLPFLGRRLALCKHFFQNWLLIPASLGLSASFLKNSLSRFLSSQDDDSGQGSGPFSGQQLDFWPHPVRTRASTPQRGPFLPPAMPALRLSSLPTLASGCQSNYENITPHASRNKMSGHFTIVLI